MEASGMQGRVCVVTGASSGIGFETARGLAQAGATVVLACRDAARGEAARASIAASTGAGDRLSVMALDLASFASVRAFAAAFKSRFEKLHVLVENAGVTPVARQTTADGLEMTIGTNHFGHFLLARELLPQLRAAAPSRIVVVSSKLHKQATLDFDDLQFEKRPFAWGPVYGASKLANTMFAVSLAERLAGSGVTVNAVHPGTVRTALMRDFNVALRAIVRLFFASPEKGARTSLFAAMAPALDGVTGKYFEDSKEAATGPAVSDRVARERLWAVTEEIIAARSPAEDAAGARAAGA
jgi:NAD(P)-dependent dehydrogenase (short-subunit alcohol dehydrogenase family)